MRLQQLPAVKPNQLTGRVIIFRVYFRFKYIQARLHLNYSYMLLKL